MGNRQMKMRRRIVPTELDFWPVDGAAIENDVVVAVMEEDLPEIDPGKEVTLYDLQQFTENFSKERVIGRTQFGILYRGTIPQGYCSNGLNNNNNVDKFVTIKMWDTRYLNRRGMSFNVTPQYLLEMMKYEIVFLSLPFLHNNPFVPKVLGYCFKDNELGVIYDLNPLNTLHNIVHLTDFGWRNRIKVALGLARFLSFCHAQTPKYLVRNLAAAHVIVDKDFNPVLVDFAMILGGVIGDDMKPGYPPESSFGYFDHSLYTAGFWTEKTDVYTFGVVLLELIEMVTCRGLGKALKRDDHVDIVHMSICLYKIKVAEKGGNVTLVRAFLWGDPDFDADDGTKISKLAMDCVQEGYRARPTMQDIVYQLEKMNVIIKNAVN